MQSNAALEYDYSVVKLFMWTTVIFGFVGMLIGVIIASQLAWPDLNYLLGEYGTFSRLRPLHTNVVVYGFMLSAIWASLYYSSQRVLKVSIAESGFLKFLTKLHFFLYMIIAVFMVLSLALGITANKEYAQMEWPLDVLVVLTWVVFGMALFGRLVCAVRKHYISLCGIILRSS